MKEFFEEYGSAIVFVSIVVGLILAIATLILNHKNKEEASFKTELVEIKKNPRAFDRIIKVPCDVQIYSFITSEIVDGHMRTKPIFIPRKSGHIPETYTFNSDGYHGTIFNSTTKYIEESCK